MTDENDFTLSDYVAALENESNLKVCSFRSIVNIKNMKKNLMMPIKC